MKAVLVLFLAGCFLTTMSALSPAVRAAEAAPALTPDLLAQYEVLTRAETEIGAQLALFTEMAKQHADLAEEAVKGSQQDKAKWEGELAQELKDRQQAAVTQLAEATKRRLAFEAAHGAPAGPVEGALAPGKAYNADEVRYLTRLDERLVKVREGLAAAMATEKGLYAELRTNSTAAAVGRVSDLLGDNTKQVRQWEHEASDLELKKLEFRALRK